MNRIEIETYGEDTDYVSSYLVECDGKAYLVEDCTALGARRFAARPGSPQERALLTLWLSTLFCLVIVMAPPIYANTRHLEFSSLPAPVLLVWSACVAMSTFLVLGGVGYAEREAVARPVAQTVAPVALATVNNASATPAQDGRNKAQLVTQYATDHPDATQADIARALQVNPATVSRAMKKE